MNATPRTDKFTASLSQEAGTYGVSLSAGALAGLARYYELLSLWNSRVHLVGPCTPEEFATRHVLESLSLLNTLPGEARVVEVGAGAALPILPCLVVKPDLQVVLIEASKKKAIFLREALTITNTSDRASVIAERFESVSTSDVGFVTCRALERFDEMLPHLLAWAPSKSTLLLFGGKRIEHRIESLGFAIETELMPRSKSRFLFVVKKT